MGGSHRHFESSVSGVLLDVVFVLGPAFRHVLALMANRRYRILRIIYIPPLRCLLVGKLLFTTQGH